MGVVKQGRHFSNLSIWLDRMALHSTKHPTYGWFGGSLWEINETPLMSNMGNEILTYEEVFTLLTKIEAYLISKSMTIQSNSPND